MILLTAEDFKKEYQDLLNLILKLEKALVDKNTKALDRLTALIEEKADKLDLGNVSQISGFKEGILKDVSKALREQEVGMNYIRDYIRNLKNGKDGRDADEARIVKEVLSQIKLPEQKEIILDNPFEVRDKLESIKEENDKLSIEAIRDLRKELDEIRQLKTQRLGGGGFSLMAMTQYMIYGENPVDSGDHLTFTIAHTPVSGTLTLYRSRARQNLTEDYTISGKTITLTVAFDSDNESLIADYIRA